MISPKHRLQLPTRRARRSKALRPAHFQTERVASKMPAVLADGADNDVVG